MMFERFGPTRRSVAVGGVLLALILGVLYGLPAMTGSAPPAPPEPYFDRLLRIATVADDAFDALHQPWPYDLLPIRWDPPSLTQVDIWRDAIVRQITEEGVKSPGTGPPTVSFKDFGDEGSQVLGRYTLAGTVEINARFRDDPAWVSRSWLDVLVHELVHAQGLRNEAQTQIVTYETLAALGNLGFPYALAETLDDLRYDSIITAWWIARYGQPVHPTTKSATGLRACGVACGDEPVVDPATGKVVWPSGDPVLLARVEAVRSAIFSPTEYRRALARERYWEGSGRDYAQVVDAYGVRPLATILASVCDDDPTLIEWLDWSAWGTSQPHPPIRMDDMDAIMREIGGC